MHEARLTAGPRSTTPKVPSAFTHPTNRLWLRKRLLLKDFADLQARRPAPPKKAYKARVRSIMRTRLAQANAQKFASDFRRVCKEVIKKKGAA